MKTSNTRAMTHARVFATACAAGLMIAVPARGADWQYSLTPYLWAPNINGTLKYGVPPGAGGSPEVEVGPNDYLTNLNFAMTLAGEARKGKWSIFTDIIYLDFSAEGSGVTSVDFAGTPVGVTLDTGTKTSFTGLTWTVGGGYSVVQTPGARLDVFGGFRYFGVEVSTDWNLSATVAGPGGGLGFPRTGSVSKDVDLWDALIGVRGRIKLGEGDWSMPYYLDVGTGSSSLTWQGLLGVAYAFGWGDVTLAYRHLYYDQQGDKLIQDMRLSGPALAATFRF